MRRPEKDGLAAELGALLYQSQKPQTFIMQEALSINSAPAITLLYINGVQKQVSKSRAVNQRWADDDSELLLKISEDHFV